MIRKAIMFYNHQRNIANKNLYNQNAFMIDTNIDGIFINFLEKSTF